MSRSRVVSALAASLVGLGGAQAVAAHRSPRLFEVDLTTKTVTGPAPAGPRPLALDLVGVSVDQGWYRPHEVVHLRLLLPGRPGARITVVVRGPQGTLTEVRGELDDQGVAVLRLLDGAAQRLLPGEHRVEVRTGDERPVGSTTFLVLEGPAAPSRAGGVFRPPERASVTASGGVTWVHRLAFGPGEQRGAVPGLSVERLRGADEAFELDQVVAPRGTLTVRVLKDVTAPALVVWTPRTDGTFEPRPQQLPSALKAGQTVAVQAGAPWSLVTLGGFVGSRFHEGWSLAFVPVGLQPGLEAPELVAPGSKLVIGVSAREPTGALTAVSGILEVFEDGPAPPSASSGLDAALAESVRATSAAFLDRKDRPRRERSTPSQVATGEAAPGSEGPGRVVYCGAVRTDASGRSTVEVTVPPLTGRLSVRFVVVRGLEHAEVTRSVEVARKATAAAVLPAAFFPGTRLELPVAVTNTLEEPVTLTVSGEGLGETKARTLQPGRHLLQVPWAPARSGSLALDLAAADGALLEHQDLPFLDVAAQRVTSSRLLVAGHSPIAVGADETAMVYAGTGALLRALLASQLAALDDWFGHAEALSARVAAQALLLSASSRRLLDEEGLPSRLQGRLGQDLVRLEESFFDPQTGLVRPYPGHATSTTWSVRVSANLHRAARALRDGPEPASVAPALERLGRLTVRLDAALRDHGVDTRAHGYDAEGQEVLALELDGQVAYRALGDEAVPRWVAKRLLPALGPEEDLEQAFAPARDRFRFLSAYQQSGALPYLTTAATALYRRGDRAAFQALFARLARGLLLSPEPGTLHGPAVLGGTYSTPMAQVRFLELLVGMADGKPTTGRFTVGTPSGIVRVTSGAVLSGVAGTSISPPAGSVVRLDRPGTFAPFDGTAPGRPLARAELAPRQLPLGHPALLHVSLDPKVDPLEYFAILAVPTVTSVRPTAESLSDSARVLTWGRPAAGSTTRLQVVAVPFAGARTLRLMLEGTWAGSAPGALCVRHLENPRDRQVLPLPPVTVKGP